MSKAFEAEVPLTIKFRYYSATPDTWTQPGDPEEIEIDYVILGNKALSVNQYIEFEEDIERFLLEEFDGWYDGAPDE